MGCKQLLESVLDFRRVLLATGHRMARMTPRGNDGVGGVFPSTRGRGPGRRVY